MIPGSGDLIKEIEDGVALLIYDLPSPRQGFNGVNDRKTSGVYRAWKSWYEKVSDRLSSLGYKIQYSVVMVPYNEKTIKEVEALKQYADYSLKKLWDIDRDGVIPRRQADIKLIVFKPSSRQDAEALLSVFKATLKESLEHLRDLIKAWLKEKKPKEYMESKTREYLKKVRGQDKLNLLERDQELKQLLAEIDVLSS